MNYREVSAKLRSNFNPAVIKPYNFTARFFRASSFLLTPLFIRCGITANQVTVFCAGLVVLSLILIGTGSKACFVVAAILFFVNSLLDYVDGDISRYLNSASYLGKFLDGTKDKVFITFFPLACSFGLVLSDHEHASRYALFGAIVTSYEAFSLYVEARVSGFVRRVKLDGGVLSSKDPRTGLAKKFFIALNMAVGLSSILINMVLPLALLILSFTEAHLLYSIWVFSLFIFVKSSCRLFLALERANTLLRVHRISRCLRSLEGEKD